MRVTMGVASLLLLGSRDVSAQTCANIAGEYDFVEISTLTGRTGGIVETYTVNERGVVLITQIGCKFTYQATQVTGEPEPFAGNGTTLPRSGSISGTKLTLFGTSFFPLPKLAQRTITSQTTSATGTVNNDSISLTGTGDVTAEINESTRLTWTSKVTLTRRGSAPLILTQPVSQTVTAGSPVSLSVSAMGSEPLSYQWKRSGVNLAGASNAVLTITSAALTDAGDYTVTISNFKGAVTSQAAVLKVNPAAIPPAAWIETWESAALGTSKPGGEVDTLIKADQGNWFIGDTVSNSDDCGPVLNTAEIILHGGSKAMKLTSFANDGGCAENIWVGRSSKLAPLAIPLAADTTVSFYEEGWLEQPESSRNFPCLLPPCADTVLLGVSDSQSNLVAYILQRAPDYTEHAIPRVGANPGYVEIFLEPEAGSFSRRLLDDFRRIPGYVPGGVTISEIYFEVGSKGWAILDNLRIGPGLLEAAPVITSQPESQTVAASSKATFRVTALATPSPSYQWQRLPSGARSWSNVSEGTDYSGATASTLVVSAVPSAMNGDRFRCLVSNSHGSVTSDPATLTVSGLSPVILSQPASVTVPEGSPFNLAVQATGTEPLTYRWEKEGFPVPGATSPTYAVAQAGIPDAGRYIAVVSNEFGAVRSEPATVTVTVTPGLPDLVVTDLVVTAYSDGQLTYTCEIQNVGSAPANLDGPTDENWDNVSVRAFQSADMVFDNEGDVAAGGSILGVSPLGLLSNGETFKATLEGPLPPASLATHPYLVLKVDSGDVIAEANENNNTRAVLIPEAALRFTRVSREIGGEIGLVLTSPPGSQVVIQASTNLVDWQPISLISNLTGTVVMRHAGARTAPSCIYRAHTSPSSSVLFDNGLSSGSQWNTGNDLDQRLYEDFTIPQTAVITGFFWQQQDQPAEFFRYQATRVSIYAGLPEASPAFFSQDLTAIRTPNNTPRLFQNVYGWFEGFDYTIDGLSLLLSPGTYWIGLNTIGDGPGRTGWDNTSGTPQSRPGWRIVSENFPAPGQVTPGNLVLQIRGRSAE